jgi:hypothetical protein
MGLVGIFTWLHDTAFSVWLRDSLWAEPIFETIHVLTLTVFFGFTMLVDLRLLGVSMKNRRVNDVLRQLNPWMIGSLAVMIVSGILLFSGDPISFYATIFFKVKMILLVVAGLNVLAFELILGNKVETWDLGAAPPTTAKVFAVVSICCWVAIIAAGRAIAYVLPPP